MRLADIKVTTARQRNDSSCFKLAAQDQVRTSRHTRERNTARMGECSLSFSRQYLDKILLNALIVEGTGRNADKHVILDRALPAKKQYGI